MLNQFSKIRPLLGVPAMERLKASRVAIFGLGGVGGYVVEVLVQSGVGVLDLINNDKVCLMNLNRQILVLHSTVGKYKAEIAMARMAEINPDCHVIAHHIFYLSETADYFDFRDYDYVVNTIDTITGKTQLILQAKEANTKIISCMGADDKLDPTKFAIADTYKTSMDLPARVIRHELKEQDVRKCKVVYSTETPVRPLEDPNISCRDYCVCSPGTERECTERRDIPDSTAFVPTVAGLILAGEMVRELAGRREA